MMGMLFANQNYMLSNIYIHIHTHSNTFAYAVFIKQCNSTSLPSIKSVLEKLRSLR